MGKRNFAWWLSSVSILCILILIGQPSAAAEFTATMVDHEGTTVKSSAITVKGSNYRMDLEEGGEKLSVIVDQEAGITRVMLPGEKMYMEIKSQDPQSLMNDPFQAAIYSAGLGGSKNVGEETVNGLECDKYVISISGQDVMTQWVAKKYQFPIKIANHMTENKFIELTEIVEGPVDAGLFQIPEGYSKWVDPADLPVEIPEWAKELASAPVMTPPFEKDMSVGEIIRIPVVVGQSAWIKGVGRNEGPATARAIPFIDGRPVKEPSMYNNFAQQGIICVRRNETSVEADEIIIYVSEGQVGVTAKLRPMSEKSVPAGEEFRFPVATPEYIEARFANAYDGESECLVSFYKDGIDISEAPVEYRTISFEKPKDNKQRTYDSEVGTEVVVQVTKGEVVVKMGQYDSFEF